MKRIALLMLIISAFMTGSVSAISETKEKAIIMKCDVIRDNLKEIQRSDSRARTYLGGYYETILSGFMMPLNGWIEESGRTFSRTTVLLDNQDDFYQTRRDFQTDYIEYQRGLEELVLIDCETEPEKFYEKLVSVRTKRKKVVDKTVSLQKLANKQIKLVKELGAEL